MRVEKAFTNLNTETKTNLTLREKSQIFDEDKITYLLHPNSFFWILK